MYCVAYGVWCMLCCVLCIVRSVRIALLYVVLYIVYCVLCVVFLCVVVCKAYASPVQSLCACRVLCGRAYRARVRSPIHKKCAPTYTHVRHTYAHARHTKGHTRIKGEREHYSPTNAHTCTDTAHTTLTCVVVRVAILSRDCCLIRQYKALVGGVEADRAYMLEMTGYTAS